MYLVDSNDLVICPKCKSPVSLEASNCLNCGTQFSPAGAMPILLPARKPIRKLLMSRFDSIFKLVFIALIITPVLAFVVDWVIDALISDCVNSDLKNSCSKFKGLGKSVYFKILFFSPLVFAAVPALTEIRRHFFVSIGVFSTVIIEFLLVAVSELHDITNGSDGPAVFGIAIYLDFVFLIFVGACVTKHGRSD
jgi:hypothetical protein